MSITMEIVPHGWRRRRLRFDATLNPKKSSLQLDDETEVSFVPMEAVGEIGGLDLSRTKPLADVYNGYTYFSDNDVCVAKITPCFENGKGALAEALTNGVGFGTTELHVLRSGQEIEPRFLFYVSIAHDFRNIGAAEMFGAGGQKRVPEDFIKDWRPVLPPIGIQRRIAEFLDNKAAQIDALIEKKRALLDRLAEKRQALITHAVTKGLNPNAPMKDSGIDWLGEIPAHWKVLPVKRAAKLQSGHTPDKKIDAYWEDCNIPWVSLNDTATLRANDYISETAFNVNELGLANSSAHLLPERAVVFTRDATIGESAITSRPMAVSQHIIAWLCNEELVIPEFLLFAIYGMTTELMKLTNGSTINTIGLSDVKRIQVALPPIEEQRTIISYVFDGKSKIAHTSERIAISVDRLVEYRSALITAAVTGQLDLDARGRTEQAIAAVSA